jgi:hypothetical protein
LNTLTRGMEAIKDALKAMLPGRVITRSLKPFDQRSNTELAAGVVTIMCGGESDFAEYIGREADLGEMDVKFIGQVLVAANSDPVAVEDAEGQLIDEVKAFCAYLVPETIDQVRLESWRTSQQLDHPYGWVVFDMKIRVANQFSIRYTEDADRRLTGVRIVDGENVVRESEG